MSTPKMEQGRGGAKPLTPLQGGVVYGPIHSRRLGNSLGINPLPASYKFCDFDCVYCQYGWTPEKGTGEKLKRLPELILEIEKSFKHYKKEGVPIDCITFAGNGEPTIHPDFPGLVDETLKLRDQYYPKAKVGILTDSSQSDKPEIRRALEKLDERYMKLDAGTAELVAKINKPRGHFNFDRMVQSLCEMKDIVVQSLFMQGSYDNTMPEQIEAWANVVKKINPREVQVYSIDRGPADPGLIKVSAKRLHEIAEICEKRTGIKSVVFE